MPAPTVLRGCQRLYNLGQTKHHPQKRHLPRQAGQAQTVLLLAYSNLLAN